MKHTTLFRIEQRSARRLESPGTRILAGRSQMEGVEMSYHENRSPRRPWLLAGPTIGAMVLVLAALVAAAAAQGRPTMLLNTVANGSARAGLSHIAALATNAYNNGAIADKALSYVGEWGGNACRDAQRSGMNGSGPYPARHDGQCRAFVNCIVWMVSNHTQWLGGLYGSTYNGTYFAAFLRAGGIEINTVDALVKGDIVQVGNGGHTVIVISRLSGNTFDVVDSNYGYTEMVNRHSYTFSLSTNVHAFRMGTASPIPTPGPPARAQQLVFIDNLATPGRYSGVNSIYVRGPNQAGTVVAVCFNTPGHSTLVPGWWGRARTYVWTYSLGNCTGSHPSIPLFIDPDGTTPYRCLIDNAPYTDWSCQITGTGDHQGGPR
jgi:hypothetical protein